MSPRPASEKGAAVIEFAVLLLLLLIMLAGIAEYGFLWLQKHYIETSAREGARVGARVATLSEPPGSVLNLESTVRPLVTEAVRNTLAKFYGDRVDALLAPVAIEGPGDESLPSLRVNVTVNTSAYWTPVVWSLLALLPGCDERNQGIATLGGSASFAIEPH